MTYHQMLRQSHELACRYLEASIPTEEELHDEELCASLKELHSLCERLRDVTEDLLDIKTDN